MADRMEYSTTSIALLLVMIGTQAAQQCALSKNYCALCDKHVACEHTVSDKWKSFLSLYRVDVYLKYLSIYLKLGYTERMRQ